MASPATATNSVATGPNTLGAVVFWLYVAAALYLLFVIVLTLFELRSETRYSGQISSNATRIYIHTALAIASMSTLSYNMLNVLIQCYSEWSLLKSRLEDGNLLSPASLWKWPTESTLFMSFAEEIAASPQRWFWAQSELGLTMLTAYWMGIEGRGAEDRDRVPKLWALFALLQILPTSIVLNLFAISKLLVTQASSLQDQRRVEIASSLQPFGIWAGIGIVYYSVLFHAGQPGLEGEHLIKLVLFARTLLIFPLFLPIQWVRAEDSGGSSLKTGGTTLVMCSGTITAALSAYQAHRAISASLESLEQGTFWWLKAWAAVWHAKDEHPAVASLGYDAMQCLIAFSAWYVSA